MCQPKRMFEAEKSAGPCRNRRPAGAMTAKKFQMFRTEQRFASPR